ncbi:MAG: hypothetical protein JXA37_03650 [Chloroflexia bacterium]|nr:hypothetical protein [Chloroflexia bacterium]
MRKVWIVLGSVLLLLLLSVGSWRFWQGYQERAILLDRVRQLEGQIAQKELEQQERQQEQQQLQQQVQQLGQDKSQLEQALQACQEQEDFWEQLDRFESQLRTLRRLVPPKVVERELLLPEELPLIWEDYLAERFPSRQIGAEAQLWVLLELLSPQVELAKAWAELYALPPAGFYDLAEQRLYFVSGSALDPLDRLTFVRAYLQALQDQVFDLEEQYEAVSGDRDRALALQALAQGEAALLLQQYQADYMGQAQEQESLERLLLGAPDALRAAPRILQARQHFLYEQGQLFVLEHYTRTGWTAVDDLWGLPPESTEQILHPDRYPDEGPELVDLPALTSTLGADWQIVREDTLGEWLLRQHLEVRLGQEQAEEAADGWGGDRYILYVHQESGEACLALLLAWDDEDEAAQFVESYLDYADGRYGPIPQQDRDEREVEDGFWWAGRAGSQRLRHPGLYLELEEEQVRLVWAPSEELARRVARRLR